MKSCRLAIAATAATGNATEHSYCAAVEALFQRLYPELAVTNEAHPPRPVRRRVARRLVSW